MIDLAFKLDALRRQFVEPREQHGEWKAHNHRNHDQTHRPVRNIEKRKYLGSDLHQQPRRRCIERRSAVYIAAFEFGEEAHGFPAAFMAASLSAINFWKRGSLRNGSQAGSNRSDAVDTT